MFSDTGFMDSMLPAHRLNPFQVKNTAATNRGRGRGCESLGYCCTCPDTKKGAASRAGVNGYSIKAPTSPPLPPATDRTVISYSWWMAPLVRTCP